MAEKILSVGKSFFGKGALRLIIPELRKLGPVRAMIVTDEFMYKSGAAKKVGDVLLEAGLEYFVYYNVKPNPTVECVDHCAMAAVTYGAEILVALGGGAAIDLVKAVSILTANGGRIEDYEGVDKSKKPGMPIVAVNTTAGTGSECTTYYIITDTGRGSKMAMVDPNCMVSIAVNDVDFMMTMPRPLTAATGMDALTHSIEALLSINACPITDKDALWAVEAIHTYLPAAYNDGSNVKAREMMSYAEYAAGTAFSNAGLGMVHAMAHALGGHYNLAHGLCNAVLLPHVMEFNAANARLEERFALIAGAMGLKTYQGPGKGASRAVINEIKTMNKVLGIPEKLRALEKVRPEDFGELAALAVHDSCMDTNPIRASIGQVVETYEKAY